MNYEVPGVGEAVTQGSAEKEKGKIIWGKIISADGMANEPLLGERWVALRRAEFWQKNQGQRKFQRLDFGRGVSTCIRARDVLILHPRDLENAEI